MVKTTMKAHIEVRDLQIHPENMSFYLSAIGPYRLTSGTISHLVLKKSLSASNVIPLKIECTGVSINVDFLSGDNSNFEYDTSHMTELAFPAENVEGETDTSMITFQNVKINVNFMNKFNILILIPSFVIYPTNQNFLISTPSELRKMIAKNAFAYNEFIFKIEKICVMEKKPNFDELLGQYFEGTSVIGKYTVKKRGNAKYNQSEIDVFIKTPIKLNFNSKTYAAIREILQAYELGFKTWDVRKHMHQVCNQVPPMLSFITRLTCTFHEPLSLNIDDGNDKYDLNISKGLSFTTIFYPSCLNIQRNIAVIPPLEFYINSLKVLVGERGAKSVTIPQADPIKRSYLRSKGIFLLCEKLSNFKDNFCINDITAPGRVSLDITGFSSEKIIEKFFSLFSIFIENNSTKGNFASIEATLEKNGKKYITSLINSDYEIKEVNGKVHISLNTNRSALTPESPESSGVININNISSHCTFPLNFSFDRPSKH